jgi:hypothetical protein
MIQKTGNYFDACHGSMDTAIEREFQILKKGNSPYFFIILLIRQTRSEAAFPQSETINTC